VPRGRDRAGDYFRVEDVAMEIRFARINKEVLVSRKRISVLDKRLLPMRLKLLLIRTLKLW
jgi:hypothetical protein